MITDPEEFRQRLLDIQNSVNVAYLTLPSDEPRFIIDANSRTINIPIEFQFLGVKNDHNAETIYFEIDRYFDNEDLSQHTCVIQFANKNNSNDGGIYPVTTMDITSVEGKIIFGWEIKSDATSIVGDIYFSVRFYSIDSNDYIFTYNFNTLTAKSSILDTHNVDNQMIIENYPSELDAWMGKMDELSRGTEGKVEEIEAKGQEVLTEINSVKDSIPEDYSTLSSDVSELKGDLIDLGNDYINTHQTFINNTSCDWSLNDLQNTNMCITPIFTSKGKIVIKFDNDIVGIGLILYVISETSGSMKSWKYETRITETEYTISVDDNVRISIMATGGMATFYDRIVKATTIYTLTDDGLMNYIKNKIIGSKKIWCFGDSLTAGVITGTTTIEGSYPYWLNKFLGENVDISNFGVPGDTSQNMRDIIISKTFYGNCDIAILMIGTNGFMIGSEEDTTTPIGAYHQAIKHIIDSSKGTTKIIIMNPPKSERDGIPQRWLDGMHYKISKIANAYGIDCIDLFSYLPFDVNDRTYYSSDKTHFTKVGYYYIAFIVYNYLINNMTNSQNGGNPTFDY